MMIRSRGTDKNCPINLEYNVIWWHLRRKLVNVMKIWGRTENVFNWIRTQSYPEPDQKNIVEPIYHCSCPHTKLVHALLFILWYHATIAQWGCVLFQYIWLFIILVGYFWWESPISNPKVYINCLCNIDCMIYLCYNYCRCVYIDIS